MFLTPDRNAITTTTTTLMTNLTLHVPTTAYSFSLYFSLVLSRIRFWEYVKSTSTCRPLGRSPGRFLGRWARHAENVVANFTRHVQFHYRSDVINLRLCSHLGRFRRRVYVCDCSPATGLWTIARGFLGVCTWSRSHRFISRQE